MKQQTDQIGIITLGDRVHVSDPCYEMDCWCAGTLENVVPGRYRCQIVRIEDESEPGSGFFSRVKSLSICLDGQKLLAREHMPFEVGVDSGQAGFYDAGYYAAHHPPCKDGVGDEAWYGRACSVTTKKIPNSAFLDLEDYIKREMGDRYISPRDMRDAERKMRGGSLSPNGYLSLMEQRDDIRDQYLHEELCCWKTRETGYAGILDGCCCVASSGYGDGGYACNVGRNPAGQIIAAKIVFL